MKKELLHFQLDRKIIVGLVSGIFMVLLSCAMNFFPDSTLAAIILRNVLMIFVLGFIFPLYYVLIKEKKSLAVLGIHTEKWKISLLINVILALALWGIFSRKSTGAIHFTLENFYAITYIFVAGIFEMLFIYGFLRYRFEQAFGIIPAIILTATFYSFHHAGFQPEFVKLFFVGVLYTTVFFLTKNILIIFPFFWGVGATWDVLVDSQAGEQITNTNSFLISICLLIGMILSFLFIMKRGHQRRGAEGVRKARETEEA